MLNLMNENAPWMESITTDAKISGGTGKIQTNYNLNDIHLRGGNIIGVIMQM